MLSVSSALQPVAPPHSLIGCQYFWGGWGGVIRICLNLIAGLILTLYVTLLPPQNFLESFQGSTELPQHPQRLLEQLYETP